MPFRHSPIGSSPAGKAIEQYIRHNHLGPGDALPSEAALVSSLGVSRSSVREAMRILAALDVVEIRHGYGTYVGNMSLAPLVNGMILRLTLNSDDALENLQYVVETREALDLAVGPELVRNFTPDVAAELTSVVEAMQDKHAQGESFRREDFRFHEILQSIVENQLIKELSIALWEIHTRVLPLLDLPAPKDMGDTVIAHRHMVEALAEGSIERYQETVRQHYAPLHGVIAQRLQLLRAQKENRSSGDVPPPPSVADSFYGRLTMEERDAQAAFTVQHPETAELTDDRIRAAAANWSVTPSEGTYIDTPE